MHFYVGYMKVILNTLDEIDMCLCTNICIKIAISLPSSFSMYVSMHICTE